MSDQTVTLRITANADGTIRAVRQVGGELDRMGAEGVAGGAAASRGLKQTEAAAQRAEGAVQDLKQGVVGLVAAWASVQGATALASMADQYTNLTSRIRLVTESEQELASVRAAVFQVAQQTRQDLSTTADLYTRLARATADMGLSQNRLLGLTTTINQAFVVSGATAQEAAAAITQLSQGLASGVLRGEEFNALAEQAPIIMDLLAKQLGVTRGELRKMAEEGQLTASVLVEALGNGAAEVARQFDGMQLTIAGATTQLRNAVTEFVGAGAQASGSAAMIAGGINTLANNLGLVAGALMTVAGLFAARFVGSLLSAGAAMVGTQLAARAVAVEMGIATAATTKAGAAMTALGVAARGAMTLLGGPFGVAIAVAGTALIGLRAATETTAEMNRRLTLAQGEQALAVQASTEAFLRQERAIRAASPEIIVREIEQNNALLLQMRQRTDDGSASAGLFAARLEILAERQRELRAELQAANPQLAAQTASFTASADRVAEVLRAAQAQLAQLRQQTAQATGGAARAFQQAVLDAAGGMDALRQLRQQDKEAIMATTTALAEAERALAAATQRQREAAAGTRRAARAQSEQNAVVDAAAEPLARLNGLLDRQAEALGGPLVRAALEYRDSLVALLEIETRLAAAGALSPARQALIDQARANSHELYLQQQADAREQAAATAHHFEVQHGRMVSAAEAAAEEYHRSWSMAIDQVAWAFGDWVASGIDSFRDFGRQLGRIAQRMIADLVATFARQQILLPIQMAMVGGGGGIAGLAGQLAGGGGGMAARLAGLPGAMFGNATFGIGSSLFGLGGSIGAFGGGMASAGANMLGSGFFGSMGANLSGAFASIGGGSLAAGLGQLIPVVGQIAAIVGIVNSLAGGRLLGTRWRGQGSYRDLAIGPGGASGFDARVETRQRSLFRGRQWRETRSELSDEVRQQIEQLFDAVGTGMSAAARALGVEVPTMIAGSFRQEFDKDGKLKREFSTIAGRVFEESQEAFGQRLLAENLIATIGTRDGDASAIAERWREDAAELLAGAQFLLAAATDLRNGTSLLTEGGLAAVTDLVEDLAAEGESLTDTYARARTATLLLEEAMALSGITLDRSRENFVRFAVDIADAAGGIERAQSLWQTYFGTFFSAGERAEQALARARQVAGRQFADIGLDAGAFSGEGGTVAFRQMFERLLPGLSAEAVVEWLEAAEALSGVLAAQRAYNDTLAESQRAFEEASNALRSAFDAIVSAIAAARGRIADDVQGLRAAAPGFDAVGFQRGRIADLRGQLAGASATDQVGLIDQIRQATLARFEAESEQLRRVAEQQAEAAQATARQHEEARRAAEQAHAQAMRGWEAQIEAARRLRDFVDNLGLSNVSPLTAFERFDEAQALYQQALAGGDAAALQQAAQAFLEETRNVYGVSDRAVEIFQAVRGALGARADQLASAAAPVFQAPALESALGGTTTAVIDVEAAIEALRAQAIADLEGLDSLLVELRDDAEAQFQTELEALRAQYQQHEANTGVIIDTMLGVDTAQADRDAAALDVMREQLAATQALVERADAQEAVTLRLLEQQEARLVEVLGVVRDETERVARAIDFGLRAEVRR